MQTFSPQVAQAIAELLANVRITREVIVSAPENLRPVRTAPEMPRAERAAIGAKMCAFAAELRRRRAADDVGAIEVPTVELGGSPRAGRVAR